MCSEIVDADHPTLGINVTVPYHITPMIPVVTSYVGQNWHQNTFEPVQRYDCLDPWSLYQAV